MFSPKKLIIKNQTNPLNNNNPMKCSCLLKNKIYFKYYKNCLSKLDEIDFNFNIKNLSFLIKSREKNY